MHATLDWVIATSSSWSFGPLVRTRIGPQLSFLTRSSQALYAWRYVSTIVALNTSFHMTSCDVLFGYEGHFEGNHTALALQRQEHVERRCLILCTGSQTSRLAKSRAKMSFHRQTRRVCVYEKKTNADNWKLKCYDLRCILSGSDRSQ